MKKNDIIRNNAHPEQINRDKQDDGCYGQKAVNPAGNMTFQQENQDTHRKQKNQRMIVKSIGEPELQKEQDGSCHTTSGAGNAGQKSNGTSDSGQMKNQIQQRYCQKGCNCGNNFLSVHIRIPSVCSFARSDGEPGQAAWVLCCYYDCPGISGLSCCESCCSAGATFSESAALDEELSGTGVAVVCADCSPIRN